METATKVLIPNKEEISVLRSFREKLITEVKSVMKLRIPEDFKVTSAGQKGKGFKLEVIFERPQNNYLNSVKSIENNLKMSGICEKSSDKFMNFDFKDFVTAELNRKNIRIEETSKDKPVDKKKEKYQTFLNDIRTALLPVLPSSVLEKNYMLKKYEGKKDVAEIQINDTAALNRALFVLEKSGYHVMVTGNTLIVAENGSDFLDNYSLYQRIARDLKLFNKWFEQFTHWVDENNLQIDLLTHPIPVVQSNFENEVGFQCESILTASILEESLKFNGLVPRKNVRMVYISVNRQFLAKPFVKTKVDKKGLDIKKNADGAPKYTHLTTNYDELHLLEFNRKIDLEHVEEIGKSIDEFGIIDFVKVVETDCVDGSLKKWIVDGQHTFTAIKNRKLPVVYILIKVDNLYELVRLIAVLNNRRKLWKPVDYLNAWVSINVPIYKTIKDWVDKKLPFSLILETISGKERNTAAQMFKDGNFTEDPSIPHQSLLSQVLELKPLLPRSMRILLVMARVIATTEKFDLNRMKKILDLRKGQILFGEDDTLPQISRKIREMYEKG